MIQIPKQKEALVFENPKSPGLLAKTTKVLKIPRYEFSPLLNIIISNASIKTWINNPG